MTIREFNIAGGQKKLIDILNPTASELDTFCSTHNLSAHNLRDCLEPDHLPKYETGSNLDFIISRVLISDNEHSQTIQNSSTKVAIFINETLIILVHRIHHKFIDDLIEKYVINSKLDNTYHILTKLLKGVLYSFEGYHLSITKEIDAIEDTIFLKNRNDNFLEDLYYLKRRAAIGKKLLLFTREILTTLKSHHHKSSDLQDLIDFHSKLELFFDQMIEDVNNLMAVYLSVSSQKTNDVMKVLTIFSAFFLPLTFIVGIYGMNFKWMPELEHPMGYPLTLATMILIVGVIWMWFKRKKWL